MEKIGLLFTPTSGHSGQRERERDIEREREREESSKPFKVFVNNFLVGGFLPSTLAYLCMVGTLFKL